MKQPIVTLTALTVLLALAAAAAGAQGLPQPGVSTIVNWGPEIVYGGTAYVPTARPLTPPELKLSRERVERCFDALKGAMGGTHHLIITFTNRPPNASNLAELEHNSFQRQGHASRCAFDGEHVTLQPERQNARTPERRAGAGQVPPRWRRRPPVQRWSRADAAALGGRNVQAARIGAGAGPARRHDALVARSALTQQPCFIIRA